MVALSELGDRICILGPSNSGKSTLADAISRTTGVPAVHLDVLFHVPGTDWKPRPFAEFERLHEAAVQTPRWVMDGNYTQLLPGRLARATGFLLLDISTPLSLFRYVRRSLLGRGRVGGLEGGRDSVKWEMVRHLAVITPRNRRRYAAMYDTVSVPKVWLSSARQIEEFYLAQGLRRSGL